MGDIIKDEFGKDEEHKKGKNPKVFVSVIIGKMAESAAKHSFNNAKGYHLVSQLVSRLQTDFAKEAVYDLVGQMHGGAPQGRHDIDSDVIKNLPDRISCAFDGVSGVDEIVIAEDKRVLGEIKDVVDRHLSY